MNFKLSKHTGVSSGDDVDLAKIIIHHDDAAVILGAESQKSDHVKDYLRISMRLGNTRSKSKTLVLLAY